MKGSLKVNQRRGVVTIRDLGNMLTGDGALVEQGAGGTKKRVLCHIDLLVLRAGVVHASVEHAASSIYIRIVKALHRRIVRTSELRQWELNWFAESWRRHCKRNLK